MILVIFNLLKLANHIAQENSSEFQFKAANKEKLGYLKSRFSFQEIFPLSAYAKTF